MLGPNGWIAADERLATGDLAGLVAETFPDVVERGGGLPLGIANVAAQPRVWAAHATYRIHFGCAVAVAFDTWKALFAIGPLGFARLSANPVAAGAAFAFERWRLDDPELRTPERVRPLASLLADVYDTGAGPDTPDRPDREHHVRSGLIDADDAVRIDRGDARARIKPVQPKAWRELKEYIEAPTARMEIGRLVVRFCRMHAAGDGRMRFTNCEVAIDHATYAVSCVCTIVGELACTIPPWPL